MKLSVGILIVLELVQTATSTHQAWWYGVTSWNNPSALLEFPWSAMTLPTMSGLSECITYIKCVFLILSFQLAQLSRYSLRGELLSSTDDMT